MWSWPSWAWSGKFGPYRWVGSNRRAPRRFPATVVTQQWSYSIILQFLIKNLCEISPELGWANLAHIKHASLLSRHPYPFSSRFLFLLASSARRYTPCRRRGSLRRRGPAPSPPLSRIARSLSHPKSPPRRGKPYSSPVQRRRSTLSLLLAAAPLLLYPPKWRSKRSISISLLLELVWEFDSVCLGGSSLRFKSWFLSPR